MNMKYGLYGALVLLGMVFAFMIFSAKGPITGNGISAFKSIDSGSTSMGDVSIELTPYEVKDGQLIVDIAANTHSVDLSQFNLKEISTLEYDGKSVKPVSASRLSGHHSKGQLIFQVEDSVTSFTIRINGIPKVGERIFRW